MRYLVLLIMLVSCKTEQTFNGRLVCRDAKKFRPLPVPQCFLQKSLYGSYSCTCICYSFAIGAYVMPQLCGKDFKEGDYSVDQCMDGAIIMNIKDFSEKVAPSLVKYDKLGEDNCEGWSE